MAKNRFSGSKALAMIFAGLSLGISGQSQFIPANSTIKVQSNKEAVNKMGTPITVASKKTDFSGGDNPFKHYRKGERNQRQYRKWVRQNPSLRRSKKCKI